MDDVDFEDIDFLPGIDLYLWLRIVIAVLAVAVSAAVVAAALT